MSKMANGSAVETYYIEEVSGAIAANPAWKPIRFVSSGLTPNINQIDTAEMNQSRQRPPSRGGTYSVAGDIAVELSFASFDDLIQSSVIWRSMNVPYSTEQHRTCASAHTCAQKSICWL
ncbi:phage tail tube protein [Pseudomonas sp. 21LCFQ02]|uniref:phage tail tube protein n=1 Tax=unclassified Pseudomonas TaxID=196821 RepID=UPI00209B5633|nr:MULTISPECIES: phage tail tube protein [unclassified Pseudomonas]MCO8167836.1 phage tail tube protein [Pseudomonas sp. 21LCFQ02]MCQ9426614.1 phage tail tube protein [Pseudomonas sp. LJDD11]